LSKLARPSDPGLADKAAIDIVLGIRLPAHEKLNELSALNLIYNTDVGPILSLGRTAVRCETMLVAKNQAL
jgi:hypothetical protein